MEGETKGGRRKGEIEHEELGGDLEGVGGGGKKHKKVPPTLQGSRGPTPHLAPVRETALCVTAAKATAPTYFVFLKTLGPKSRHGGAHP